MTQHERFVREVLWPTLLNSNQSMTRQDIEHAAPGIRCSGFISHLIKKKHGKPILEEVGEQDGRSLLKITPHWKKLLDTVEKAVEVVANRVHDTNNAYYVTPAREKLRKKLANKKKREKAKESSEMKHEIDQLAAVISGKPTQEKINVMKAEVLDLLLKGPGVREAVLTKLKVKVFAWER